MIVLRSERGVGEKAVRAKVSEVSSGWLLADGSKPSQAKPSAGRLNRYRYSEMCSPANQAYPYLCYDM